MIAVGLMVSVLCAGCAMNRTARDGGNALFRVVKVNRFLRMQSLKGEGFMDAGRNQPNITEFQSGVIPFDKRGEEFVVTWRYDGPAAENVPVKLCFDYSYRLQPQTYRIEETYNTIVPGRYVFRFQNFGDSYAQNGQVEDWKVTIFYGDKPVHEKKSVFFGKN